MTLREWMYYTLESRGNTYKGREIVESDKRDLVRFEIQVCAAAYRIFKSNVENIPGYKEKMIIENNKTLVIFGNYITLKESLDVEAYSIGEDAATYIIGAVNSVINDRIKALETAIQREEDSRRRAAKHLQEPKDYIRFQRYDVYGSASEREIQEAINEYMRFNW